MYESAVKHRIEQRKKSPSSVSPGLENQMFSLEGYECDNAVGLAVPDVDAELQCQSYELDDK